MNKYIICNNGISFLMIRRILQPFIIGIIFLSLDLILISKFNQYSNLGISLIVLSFIGIVYTLFYLKLKQYCFNEIVIKKIKKVCIIQTKSIDYGDLIFYPFIEYDYTYQNKHYSSKQICLDMRSCYLTEWSDKDNGLRFATDKLTQILQNKKVFTMKVLPFISYVDISLTQKRKMYFKLLLLMSLLLFFLGFFLL